MRQNEFIARLLEFIGRSPTGFHAVEAMASILAAHGFRQLDELDTWKIGPGRYFVTRDQGSLIGFVLGEAPVNGLWMAGAHTDSPGLKLKPNPIRRQHDYLQFTAEVYGSPLLSSWFDRELSLAGRVIRRLENNRLSVSLVDLQRPVAIIPSLAIHLQPKDKKDIDRQTAPVPILQTWTEKEPPSLQALLDSAGTDSADATGELLDFDLFLYDCHPPVRTGLQGEFISGPRLDNLVSCFCLVQALVEADPPVSCLISCHDHEEVGSGSASGAASPFLPDVLARILPLPEERIRAMQGSVFLSVDNAHGIHPNFAAEHDPQHQPLLNRGPVIKVNANKRYATSGRTAALFRHICSDINVNVQEFVMRNDKGCGSTIGPLLSRKLGIQTLDVGIPSLAMHAIRELVGQEDCWSMFRCLKACFGEEVRLP